MFVEEDRVLFTGDVVMSGVPGRERAIGQRREMDREHGCVRRAVADRRRAGARPPRRRANRFATIADYLTAVRDETRAAKRQGQSLEAAQQALAPCWRSSSPTSHRRTASRRGASTPRSRRPIGRRRERATHRLKGVSSRRAAAAAAARSPALRRAPPRSERRCSTRSLRAPARPAPSARSARTRAARLLQRRSADRKCRGRSPPPRRRRRSR